MKVIMFQIKVRSSSGRTWTEDYTKPVGPVDDEWGNYHPDNFVRGSSQEAVEEWSQALIAWFNRTLRPHEKPRELIWVRILSKAGTAKENK